MGVYIYIYVGRRGGGLRAVGSLVNWRERLMHVCVCVFSESQVRATLSINSSQLTGDQSVYMSVYAVCMCAVNLHAIILR